VSICGEGGSLPALPLVRQPLTELAHRRGRQVGQQLREVDLRIDAVAAAGAGEAGEDGGGLAAALVADWG